MKAKKQNNYRSGLEAEICGKLDDKEIDYKYEPITLLYEVPAQLKKYTPDVVLPNGIVVEIKGRFTAYDRKKMVLVIEQNPDLDIRMLFERDHKLSKRSKTRYTEWCKKRNIQCAVGREIPEEWLNE